MAVRIYYRGISELQSETVWVQNPVPILACCFEYTPIGHNIKPPTGEVKIH